MLRNLFLILSTIAFSAIGLWMMISGEDLKTKALGTLCVLFFGLGGGFALFLKFGGHGRVTEIGNGGREIRPASWHVAVMIVVLIAVTVAGVAMVIAHEGFMSTAKGVFVAAVGVLALYWVFSRKKASGKLVILPEGLQICASGLVDRVIPWKDIEGFGVVVISRQEFTTIRLSSYAAILENLTDDEAKRAVKFFRGLRMVGYATTIMQVADFGDASDLAKWLSGSSAVKSVAAILQHSREKFGGEFFLGAMMRDRSARDFATYLEELRQSNIGRAAGAG